MRTPSSLCGAGFQSLDCLGSGREEVRLESRSPFPRCQRCTGDSRFTRFPRVDGGDAQGDRRRYRSAPLASRNGHQHHRDANLLRGGRDTVHRSHRRCRRRCGTRRGNQDRRTRGARRPSSVSRLLAGGHSAIAEDRPGCLHTTVVRALRGSCASQEGKGAIGPILRPLPRVRRDSRRARSFIGHLLRGSLRVTPLCPSYT